MIFLNNLAVKSIFYLTSFALLFLWSCDDDCFDEVYRSQYLFHLELLDAQTGNNLFLGNNAIYPLDSFQLYKMNADSLQSYEYHFTDENPYFIISCEDIYEFSTDIGGEIIDTFYFKIPGTELNMLTFDFNQVETKCQSDFVESYDVSLNGNLVCEGCTVNDEILILD